MKKDKFIEEIERLGINPTSKQLEQLEQYYKLLIEWNSKINLTRIIEEDEVYLKHFYDSLTLFKAINLYETKNLLDVGTGAGFPGIVLKIFFPNINIVLLDSLNKRLKFIQVVIEKLGLEKIELVHARVEEYKERKFDIITTRAVANLKKLLIYINPLITKDTKFVPMKANVDEEIIEAKDILNKYKLEITKKIDFTLPETDAKRCILIIQNK